MRVYEFMIAILFSREMQRQAEDCAMKAEKMKETVRTSRKFGIDVKQSQGLKVDRLNRLI